jgi:peptidoglycan hydrolase-like protein with peptidoglycan-binding domain
VEESAMAVRLLGSVGDGGMNRQADVVVVQTLLNAYLQAQGDPNRIPATGMVDNVTIGAISSFQRRAVGLSNPDGRVDPHGPTIRKLCGHAGSSGRRVLPSFWSLWKSYPAVSLPCDQGYENQCAIRISVALIGAGFDLTGYADNLCRHGHARGAESLARYLSRVVRLPERAKHALARRMCNGRTGLVFFRNIAGFRNSRGDHIDLWDGTKTKGFEYFMESEETWLWQIS